MPMVLMVRNRHLWYPRSEVRSKTIDQRYFHRSPRAREDETEGSDRSSHFGGAAGCLLIEARRHEDRSVGVLPLVELLPARDTFRMVRQPAHGDTPQLGGSTRAPLPEP